MFGETRGRTESGSTVDGNAWVPGLLQAMDPLFPTGGYAHSMGLEAWVEASGMRSADELARFFREHAGPSLQRMELPYLRFARERIRGADWDNLFELEAEIDASKWASEIREASIAQGRGRLRVLNKLWSDTRLGSYADAVASGAAHGHHLVVAALQNEVLGVPDHPGLYAYGYQNLANFVSASIKLLRIGPESAQRALREGLESLPRWVEQSLLVDRDAVGWFAPAFDLGTARHATAFSRLFIS